jgi:hypothetical protein
MRSLLSCALFALLALPALSDDAKQARPALPDWIVQMRRMRAIEDHANDLRPARRDTPLRELNITDNEVREIQDVASRYAMSTMLNISPVVSGCPCEEGPLCTDQVFIVATLPDKTLSLQLSRIRNAWVVGAVQKWWFRYADLRKRGESGGFKSFEAYESSKNQLLLDFPMCAVKDSPAAGATTAQTRDGTK